MEDADPSRVSELTVNSGNTLAGNFVRHSPDESSNLGIDL